jgi:hypothetical protein
VRHKEKRWRLVGRRSLQAKAAGRYDDGIIRAVSRASAHNRLIAQAAKDVLAPLGLTQKGTSRVWLDDHGWWLGVVEFQPSSWSRGTYLNVGAMWLWRPHQDHIYFDLGDRVDDVPFVEYESEEQFLAQARRVAVRAGAEVSSLRSHIRSFEDVSDALAGEAEAYGSWAAWDVAVALALAGDGERAATMFARAVETDDDRSWWLPVKEDAARLAHVVVREPGAFRAEVNRWIAGYREALRLPPLTAPM